jgi:methionine-rich copper-binding protein CopC
MALIQPLRVPFASVIVAGVLAAAFLRSGAAEAHAIVLDSTPAANQTVAGPDVPIRLRFNSRIDHERSRLTLLDAAGQSQPLAIDAGGADEVLGGRARGLAAGAYRLRWQVLAVDGHITRGEVPFTVAQP